MLNLDRNESIGFEHFVGIEINSSIASTFHETS
jgi:hypothetical protein